jgi:hypothetical protein
MRLEGSTGLYCHWIVLHVPTMRQIKNVLWVDDATATYAVRQGGVLRAKRIKLMPESALVLIDPPVEDCEQSFTETMLAAV